MGVRILAIKQGGTEVTTHAAAELATLLADETRTVWVDIEGATENDEKLLRDNFALHPLVLEDVFHDSPHPKVEDFGDYLYVVVHGVSWTKSDVETIELDVLIGPRWVVTHHHDDTLATDSVAKDLERNPRAIAKGPSFLAHAILDRVTDHFSPLMDELDESIDALETEVVESPKKDQVARIFALKRALQKIRRVSVHQRDMLLRLSRGEFDRIDRAALPFYRDVYDHFVRVADLTDSYRDLVGGILEMHLSVQSQRLNEVMKILTIISTIVLPLNLIAGIWGMNFDALPGIHWKWGAVVAFGGMGVIVAGLIVAFKRRGWL